tara:strand:- start:60 stop:296 length:237 start_codon:yes stop_codon:yes gene_type:complete
MDWQNKKGLLILPVVFGAGITIVARYSTKITNAPPVGAAFGTTTTSTAIGLSWLTSIALGLFAVIAIFLLILYFQKNH